MSNYFPHVRTINNQRFKKSIYAYRTYNDPEYIKIGETTRDPEERIKEQLISSPTKHYELLHVWDAKNARTGEEWSDRDVHRLLDAHNFSSHGEFYKIDLDTLKSIMAQLCSGIPSESIAIDNMRIHSFQLRDEQKAAIDITANYFAQKGNKFLWNAKMRFGKTFTSYKLIEKMGLESVLMVTFKPTVTNAWVEDLLKHVDFIGWGFEYYSNGKKRVVKADKNKPTIYFRSFQDIKGRDVNENVKNKNKWLYSHKFDLIIFDEYHFGAWNESSKSIFNKDVRLLKEYDELVQDSTIYGKYKLYLSGTPFKILSRGEFVDDQVYTWLYVDEQTVKEKRVDDIQYQILPKMIMMSYKLPNNIEEKYVNEEGSEFSLNAFFKTDKKTGEFLFQEDVQLFLKWICGYKVNKENSPKPFFDSRLVDYLDHTYWMMHSVSAAKAMKMLIESGSIPHFRDYKVVLAADSSTKSGQDAFNEVKEAIKTHKKTITISVGMLNYWCNNKGVEGGIHA